MANGTTTIDGAGYAYDNAGNRIGKGNFLTGTMESYTYDDIYQLKDVHRDGTLTENYTYDEVGNRLTSTDVASYSYNSSNQLTAADATGFTYDHNGNTTTKTDSNGQTTYAWDYENRLTSVTLPGGGGVVSFKYDPFGRRIQKSSGSGTTIYVYDGANGVEEVNASGAVVARYVQGAGIDEPLAQSRSGLSYYNADGLGSITSLTDSTGAPTATFVYGAFGILNSSTGTTTNSYRYTAREYDSETGLYYYRARYYDSQLGRFISEDPIDFDGGTNFYAYVENNPVYYDDPDGLARCYLSISKGQLICLPDSVMHPMVSIQVASGNNGSGKKCKNNPDCSHIPERGPIPIGHWRWTRGYTSKPNGRALEGAGPYPFVTTWSRDLIRSHSCKAPFGPSLGPKFCSEGCVTGTADDIKKLNKLIDAEPGSTLDVEK